MGKALRAFRRLLRDVRGVAAIEFALVAPVLILLTVGTVDVGRLVWSASMLDHMARETTRYASVRGADSLKPATESELEAYVTNRLIGVDPNDVNVSVTWDPNNGSGSTVQVQLGYEFNFLVGQMVGLEPIQLRGESSMVVL